MGGSDTGLSKIEISGLLFDLQLGRFYNKNADVLWFQSAETDKKVFRYHYILKARYIVP